MTVTTWLAVGIVVVLIAFTAGVLSATFGWDGVMAQEAERTDPEINTEPSAPPVTPFPPEVLKLYPVTTIIRARGGSRSRPIRAKLHRSSSGHNFPTRIR